MENATIDEMGLEERLDQVSTLEHKIAIFGEILELDRPVSKHVLFGALENPAYARNLLVSRRSPEYLAYLLANPPAVEIPTHETAMPSTVELMASGASALLNWAKTGFSIVDDATLEHREEMCLNCPNLVSPTRLVQKLMPSKKENTKIGSRTGDKVCNLCGCSAAKKMRLTSESCPGNDPERPGFSRWGSPTPTN